MRFSHQIVASIVLSVGAVAPAFAWNDHGHMVSAYLAYQEMKPEARAAANALLRQHPQYDLLGAKCPEGFDKDLYIFMRAATWPDMLRSAANPLHATDHHSAWHYINFPVNRDDAKGPEPVLEWTVGTDPQNVVQALAKCAVDLKDASVSAADRAKALCWYLHLTGDLHQPLHTVALFSKDYPSGDRGGNSFVISDAGRITRLHSYWDSIVGDNPNATSIVTRAKGIAAKAELSRQSLKEDFTKQAPADWAREGVALAKESVYRNGTLQGTAHEGQNLPSTAPALPADYREKNTIIAERRIALAGFRMADDLNALAWPRTEAPAIPAAPGAAPSVAPTPPAVPSPEAKPAVTPQSPSPG